MVFEVRMFLYIYLSICYYILFYGSEEVYWIRFGFGFFRVVGMKRSIVVFMLVVMYCLDLFL